MQVTVKDVSTVKKILSIEVPEKDVVRELDNAYKTLKKKAKIKGFRPGKAPRSVLERYYKQDVHNDVASKLLQDSFIAALQETELSIVGQPQLDPPSLDEKGPYKYEATIDVKPEIGELDFKGLKLQKNLYQVSDEEVDTQLKLLQKNLAKREPITDKRPVRENDFVSIDYEGFKDGQPFVETQKTKNFTMKVGAGSILKEFDEQIIGMQPGASREIQVKFPEDYFNDKLANHEITFQTTVNEIREEKLPEIDDEFGKQLGQYDNLDEVKKAITANLMQGYDKRAEHELNEQIFEALIAKTEFELPESMVEYELEGIIEEAERSFAYYNKSMEEAGLSKEKLAEQYRGTAEKQVRRHLILSQIVEQEKLTLADEELEKGFEEIAANVNQPAEQIRSYYQQNSDKLEIFKHTLLEKDAIKLIIEKSTIENVVPEREQSDQKQEDLQ
ncbi:MAG: trigger factor [Desulfobacterales bacterium]|uniref:Trigger factor n=1 Tax=Candidatus Desulfatibia vada TaxID=2841696 RepID=A0A8J6NZN7_9BACT|nr:trigger factor [Candidatus Desulfatibia vada]